MKNELNGNIFRMRAVSCLEGTEEKNQFNQDIDTLTTFEEDANITTQHVGLLHKIYENLSKYNPDIVKDENVGIKRYFLEENPAPSLSLNSLPSAVDHILKLDPAFQRESDDHKGRTPEQIVVDYLTGQFMGYISCYKYENSSQPKLVIDGKHRITHLLNFIKGNLVLKDKEASHFWGCYVEWLYNNRDKDINKILNSLSKKHSDPDKLPSITPVKFSNLPLKFQHYINSKVNINIFDISVKCFDENGKSIVPDPKKVEELYYRKFLRINQNSANMKPEDIIWGTGSDYNSSSRSLINDWLINRIFNISNDDKEKAKQHRKLNEMVFSTLLFLDERTKWGSGGKSIIKKINDPKYDKKINGEASSFIDFYNNSIIPCFKNYYEFGNTLNIPDKMQGIDGKGTNIKYMMYFMYKIHQMSKNKMIKSKGMNLYADKLPTLFLKSLIENGSRIIVESNKDKNGNINVSSDLTHIYRNHQDIFERLSDYRKNQRDKKLIDDVFEKLVHVCCQIFDPNYTF
jgi:hypothetical protein